MLKIVLQFVLQFGRIVFLLVPKILLQFVLQFGRIVLLLVLKLGHTRK